MTNVKQQVSDFYNQTGWQEVEAGIYQNARYEDLRPVSREYIHRCHLRIQRHIRPTGKYLLDAGSGPVQYAEYVEYSRGYQRRVCADISIVALQEARKRLNEHGLYVVCDIAHLPFAQNTFDAVVSLHTVHHLPIAEHPHAYIEMRRVLAPGASAAVVNGWGKAPLADLTNGLARAVGRLRGGRTLNPSTSSGQAVERSTLQQAQGSQLNQPSGTFVRKHSAAWLQGELRDKLAFEIWVWRSVSVNFLRTFIHRRLGGRWLLKVLYWLEERFPHWMGKNGQYPLIVIKKR